MKDLLKRRAEIREKLAELREGSKGILEAVRDKTKTIDGDTRSKLEQIQIDVQAAETELDQVNTQIDGRSIAADVEARFAGMSAEEERQERAIENDDPLHNLMPIGRNYRPNLRALRNSHECFRPWATSGEFLRSVATYHKNNRDLDERLAPYFEQRGPSQFGELIDSDGGFLVPPQFLAELLQIEHTMGALLSRVRVIPMETRKVQIPAIDETSRADGSRLGGIRSYWEGEGDPPTVSKGRFKKVDLEVNKLTAATHISERLLEDAPALGAWVQMAFAEEQTFAKETAIFEGSGAGQPQGVNKSGAVVSVAKESGQTAATINQQNVIKMRARLHARSRQNAAWFVNQDCEPELSTLSLAVGAGGGALPAWLPAGGMLNAPNDTLFGKPVIPIEQAETLGTLGDINLFDLSQYLFGQRGGLQTATSIHVKFLENEQTFRFVEWCDGGSWWTSALTPYKGVNTQSPFIQLATRA